MGSFRLILAIDSRGLFCGVRVSTVAPSLGFSFNLGFRSILRSVAVHLQVRRLREILAFYKFAGFYV